MRILFNESENWFQAEVSLNEHFKDDIDALKTAGFKTTGSPDWIWYTSKVSVLKKLRDLQPKSGLMITTLALEKFNYLTEQADKKADFKAQYEKAKKMAELLKKFDPNDWVIDPVLGFEVHKIKPAPEGPKFEFRPPKPPEVICFVCGEPLYWYEYADICIWCDKLQKIPLDKRPKI